MIGQQRKWLWSAWLVLALVFIAYKGLLPGWNDKATDFNNYYASARLLLNGHAIYTFYDNAHFYEEANQLGIESGAKFAPFPPPTAALYVPIAFFDLLTAKRIWLLFNLLILLRLPFRIRHYFNTNPWQNSLLISLFFAPLAANFHFGQFYLVAAFLLTEVIGYTYLKKRAAPAALCIGVLAALKYVPILFTGYLFQNATQKYRPLVLVMLTIVAITSLFFIVDPESYSTYWNHLTGHVNGSLTGQGKYAIGFQSIDALLNNLFVFDPAENPEPIWDFPLLKPILKWGFFALIGGASYYLLRRTKFVFSTTTTSVLIIGAFVLFPASASYHLLLLILPVYFILASLIEQQATKPLLITVFLIIGAFSVQTHHIPSLNQWPLFNLLIHFPRLWFLAGLFAYLFYVELKKQHG